MYIRWSISEDTLKSKFTEYGNVTESTVISGTTAYNRIGFVTFETEEAASAALEAAQSGELTLTSDPIELEYATAKKARKPRVRSTPAVASSDGAEASGEGKKRRRKRGKRKSATAGESADTGAADANAEAEPSRRQPRKKVINLDITSPAMFPDLSEVSVVEAESLTAGDRKFRRRTKPRTPAGDAELVASTVIKGEPTPAVDFSLGDFALKLLSVSVKTDDRDARITCRVYCAEREAAGEIYLRVRPDGTKNYKFFEVGVKDLDVANFATIEGINVDLETGAWSDITFGLQRFDIPPPLPAKEETFDDMTTADEVLETTSE